MQEAGPGLFDSAKNLLGTLTSVIATRLELLANEVQEERVRLTQMLFFALAALFFMGMGVLLLTVFIVVFFWDDHRLAVVGSLSLLFFVLGTLMAVLLRRHTLARPRLFSDSLAELRKDKERLAKEHPAGARDE
ncbi:MAG: phage holin family protein [Gallionella sp.]|nr:phage holin family protein [Gallionella sp.]